MRFIFLLLLFLGVASLAAVATGYVFLPQATITITPATIERTMTQEVQISGEAQQPDFVSLLLPATTVEAKAFAEKTWQRSGGEPQEDFARGTVTLTNNRFEDQELLPQTHLRHEASGVFFLTDAAVTIPAQDTVSVTVTAKEKGAAGNVSAGRFVVDKLTSERQKFVWAQSTTTFSGGEVLDRPLTQAENSKGREQVLAQAKEQVLQKLIEAAGNVPVRDEFSTIDIEEEIVSAQVGSYPTSFSVSVRVRARAFVVDENDLLSLTLLKLQAEAAANETFVTYDPQSFATSFSAADFDQQTAIVATTLTGSFVRSIESTLLSLDQLAGLTAAEVVAKIEDYDSVAQVDVSLSPFWVATVPSRPSATEIVVKSTP